MNRPLSEVVLFNVIWNIELVTIDINLLPNVNSQLFMDEKKKISEKKNDFKFFWDIYKYVKIPSGRKSKFFVYTNTINPKTNLWTHEYCPKTGCHTKLFVK